METRDLDKITPYDRNPRKNKAAVDRVLESLNRHGQIKPIVLSAKGKPFEQETVCAGHTTLEALKRFGAKEVKVVVKEFADEAQFLDYNIRDNKAGEFAEWDEQMLADLGAEFDVDLVEMGFDINMVEMVNGSDENDEWVDMPDFEKGDDVLKIIFSFESEADREKFENEYKFKMLKKQGKTWSTWFPFKEREDRTIPHED